LRYDEDVPKRIIVILFPIALALASRAEDWPQWRGSGRDGVWHGESRVLSFGFRVSSSQFRDVRRRIAGGEKGTLRPFFDGRRVRLRQLSTSGWGQLWRDATFARLPDFPWLKVMHQWRRCPAPWRAGGG
jgi:hypothetical protein